MKAILGNFKKISETEFRLKKDLQFADISVNESHEVQTVQYGDKQDIRIDDILTHEDRDYEIKSINTDHSSYITVQVVVVEQPYVEPPKPKFKARRMSPIKPKLKSIPLEIIKPIQEKTVEPVIIKEIIIDPEPIIENIISTPIIPKKKSILKGFVSYIGNKLTNYSDS
tara:strand:- start:145 stop:651 length:507 start_codon:yes stop_codon:yes gene_type:complete